MRNLGLVFFFIVAGLFLQGCDPGSGCSFFIMPEVSYKPVQTNIAFKDDFETSARIIEPLARREGFRGYETPKEFRKDYQRHYKERVQFISIIFLKTKDEIEIAVWELGTFSPLSQSSQDILMELLRQFQSEFGTDRIKIDEDCIAAKKSETEVFEKKES